MEYGNSYTRPSYRREDSSHQRVESTDDDTVGMLSQAAPSCQYEAYHSPNQQTKSVNSPKTRRLSATISPLPARVSTPTVLSPFPPSSSAVHTTVGGLPAPRIEQLPPDSPGFRPRLFSNRDTGNAPYQENVPWANSTQFRHTTADAPKPDFDAQIAEAHISTTPSKQYFREARHIREPWRPGIWTRFPRKGLGALGAVVLRESMLYFKKAHVVY